VPKYPGAEKSALSSHCPSFLTQPRSKLASLATTASLEGIEEVGEGFAFVSVFEAVDLLLASQSKEERLPTSTRAKSTLFLVMAIPPLSYRRILNKSKAEVVLRIQTS
jgi:hypothetical protein